MDYKVIIAGNIAELEQKVKEELRNGWKLQGGITISDWGMLQAMTK